MENENLSKALIDTQSKCVGLYQHFNGGRIELVIEDTDTTFVTVTIGDLFGLSTTTFGKDDMTGNLIYFPEGKTLYEFMNTPFEFNEWFVKNINH